MREELRAAADPEKAPAMQAYMKSEMPHLGVQAVPLRQALRPIFAAHRLQCFDEWRATVQGLWRGARFWALREYAKTDAAEVARYVRKHEMQLSPLSQREALKGVNRKTAVRKPNVSSRHRA